MASKVIRLPSADVEDFFMLGIYLQWFMLLFKTLKTLRYICYIRSLHTPPNRMGFEMDAVAFEQFRQYQGHRIIFYYVINVLKCILITCIYRYKVINIMWTISGNVLRGIHMKINERNRSFVLCVMVSGACTLYATAKYAYINYALNRRYQFFSKSIQSFIKHSVMYFFRKTLGLLIITFAVFFGHRQFGLLFSFYAWGLLLPLLGMLSLMTGFLTPSEELENNWILRKTQSLAGYFDMRIDKILVKPFLRKPDQVMYNMSHLLNFSLFRRIRLDYTIVRKEGWKGLEGNHIMAILCHQLGQYYFNHSFKTLISWMSNVFFMVVSACHFFGYALILKERPITVMLFYFILYVVDPYINLTEPLQIATQLQFIREADKFVSDNGYSQDLQEATVKMFHLEMEEDDEVSFYSFLYHPRVALYEKTVTTYRILSCGI